MEFGKPHDMIKDTTDTPTSYGLATDLLRGKYGETSVMDFGFKVKPAKPFYGSQEPVTCYRRYRNHQLHRDEHWTALITALAARPEGKVR